MAVDRARPGACARRAGDERIRYRCGHGGAGVLFGVGPRRSRRAARRGVPHRPGRARAAEGKRSGFGRRAAGHRHDTAGDQRSGGEETARLAAGGGGVSEASHAFSRERSRRAVRAQARRARDRRRRDRSGARQRRAQSQASVRRSAGEPWQEVHGDDRVRGAPLLRRAGQRRGRVRRSRACDREPLPGRVLRQDHRHRRTVFRRSVPPWSSRPRR